MDLKYELIKENTHRIIVYDDNNEITDVVERYDDRGCGKEGLFGLCIRYIRNIIKFDDITIDNFLFGGNHDSTNQNNR